MLSSLCFDLPLPALALLLAVLATAGLVSGLSGFGFSAVGRRSSPCCRRARACLC